MREYTIEFYQGNTGDQQRQLSDILAGLIAGGCRPVRQGHMDYELRNLRQQVGNQFSGVVAKFRHNDIPHAGQPGGQERDLGLNDHEGLMEKNYFIYYAQHQLLVYQRNGHGTSAQRFSHYLSEITDEIITFDPVLQQDAVRRLMDNTLSIRSIDVRFARPLNAALYPRQAWNKNMLDMMNGLGAATMSVQIKADGRSANPENRHLLARGKDLVTDLMRTTDLKKARIEVDDDGEHHAPIDLISDRLLSREMVDMHGRYPDPGSMFAALRRARNAHLQEIDAILGGDAQLD